MKKVILYQVLQFLSRSQSGRPYQLGKKIKYLALGLVVFVMLAGGFATWATFRISEKVWVALQEGNPVASMEAGRATVERITSAPLTTKACVDQVMGLISPMPWLTNSISENVASIRNVCLKSVDARETNHKR